MRVEALGQHVDEEAADELSRRQRHCLVPLAPLDPVILPLEGDAVVVGRDQPPVGAAAQLWHARIAGFDRRERPDPISLALWPFDALRECLMQNLWNSVVAGEIGFVCRICKLQRIPLTWRHTPRAGKSCCILEG
jgi:hypothetical protein